MRSGFPDISGWLPFDRALRVNPGSGNRPRCSTSDANIFPADSEAYTPTVKRPFSPRALVRNLRKVVSVSARIWRALARNSRPAIVGRVPPLVRSNSCAPSRASISLKRRLSVDCRTFNVSAACRRLLYCGATIAHFISRNSIDSMRGPARARLRVHVGQSHHVPGYQIAGHKSERRAWTGKKRLAATKYYATQSEWSSSQ